MRGLSADTSTCSTGRLRTPAAAAQRPELSTVGLVTLSRTGCQEGSWVREGCIVSWQREAFTAASPVQPGSAWIYRIPLHPPREPSFPERPLKHCCQAAVMLTMVSFLPPLDLLSPSSSPCPFSSLFALESTGKTICSKVTIPEAFPSPPQHRHAHARTLCKKSD